MIERAALEALIASWRKESAAYLRLAGIPEGSKPTDATPEQLGMVYSAGTYRLCAKQLNDLLKDDTHTKDKQP